MEECLLMLITMGALFFFILEFATLGFDKLCTKEIKATLVDYETRSTCGKYGGNHYYVPIFEFEYESKQYRSISKDEFYEESFPNKKIDPDSIKELIGSPFVIYINPKDPKMVIQRKLSSKDIKRKRKIEFISVLVLALNFIYYFATIIRYLYF